MKQEIYSKEFNLNLENQIQEGEITEPMQVGYQIENYGFWTLIFPLNYFKTLIGDGEE